MHDLIDHICQGVLTCGYIRDSIQVNQHFEPSRTYFELALLMVGKTKKCTYHLIHLQESWMLYKFLVVR